jgi:PRTRC genetic system protein F
MRKCIGSTRASIKERTKRRPVAAASRGAATCFLTLPFIARNIPVKSVSEGNGGKWLQAARLCAELVGDDELAINTETTTRDIISLALSAWASRHCADIQVLDNFELLATPDQDALDLDCENQPVPDQNILYIGVRSQQSTPFINVKAKVEQLEAVYPGLGRTAIHFAELAGYRTFTAFTPEVAFHHASYLYWYGMESDEDFEQEREAYGEEDEDDELDDGFLMPSQFLASFPDYMFTGNVLEREDIQRIASGMGEAGETAKVILSIMDLIDRQAGFPIFSNYYGESAYFSFYMGTGDDMLGRVLDDFYESTQSGEFTDMYGVSEIQLDEPSFQQWRKEMEKGFALYSQLDRLMRCIGDIQ